MSTVSCIGCGAVVDDIPGPVHAYMTSAPGCWALHGALLVRGLEWGVDRGTVQCRTDAYAAQHATNPDPRNRQSVVVHLMSLCATFEIGLAPGATTGLIGGWTHRQGGYPDLISGDHHGALTIVDALAAPDASAHAEAIHRWARSVWEGWAPQHAQIRSILAEYGVK
jgi:Family of unknown function (DUF5946)